jgi:M6 family metalloprotease-like protein
MEPFTAQAFDKNTGDLQNLVCFVRFADEAETDQESGKKAFEYAPSFYETLFNGEADGENSVYAYFRRSSYGQLSWRSSFWPLLTGSQVSSLQVSRPRTYYEEKSSVAPDGYEDDTEKANRELTLVTEICNLLNSQLTDNIVVDQNGDDIVDNLTIVLSNGSEIGNRHLLWPHRSDLMLPADKSPRIKGKRMTSYLMVFDYANGYGSNFNGLRLNTGVLCHEMSHSLGTYDLYHTSDKLNPVGVWDLMSDNQQQAQQMTVYTKYRYCKWVDDIPEISEPGTYTLQPVGGTSKEHIAYKIKPVGHDEYFVVEYRKKEGYDATIPESGLLVYRINPNQSGGNVGYNGTTRLDEQYIFRPGGTTKADGNILQAAFSQESGRTAFGGVATEKPFYSDGTTANFAIANVSACGETISFDLLEMGKQLLLSEETMTLKGQQNSGASLTIASDVAWTITGVPDWLTVSPASAGAGTTTVSITAVSDNETGAEREAVLTVSSSTDASLQKTVTIRQEAKTSGIILFDDFENTANPHGWIIENQGENGSGWQYCEGTTTGKAKKMVNSGTHALLMKETIMEDLHQESRLTSPAFAGGKTLSFYSHCNGGNSTPKNPPVYIIEVSSDGGSTWNTIFDVLKDYPRNEEGNTVNLLSYTKITLDLSPYTSDNMRIRFNCYDNTNEGLQYWWQIDDLEISAEVPSHVTGIPNADTRNESVYDLRGQRITTPATRGIYIIGGRKVMRSEK